jgi:hypothetical protein
MKVLFSIYFFLNIYIHSNTILKIRWKILKQILAMQMPEFYVVLLKLKKLFLDFLPTFTDTTTSDSLRKNHSTN